MKLRGSGRTAVDSIAITTLDRVKAGRVAPIRRAIGATLRLHGVKRACLSVALVDDATMADLHRTFLGRRGPTDVLSFDLNGSEGAHRVDGEIVLSVDTAAREAKRRGHAVDAELALYAVHGLLHLLGHDDRTARGAARMHRLEDEILGSLGIGAVFGGTAPRPSTRARRS